MKFSQATFWSNGAAFALIACVLLAQHAHGAEAKAASLEGYYSSPSKNCTRYDKAKDDFVSCEQQFQDCLLIKDAGHGKMAVEIFSTQANQHVCALNGIALMDTGKLTYRFGTEADSQRIEFIRTANKLTLKHVSPPGEAAENCGAHADWNGLEFKRVNKDVSRRACFKNE